MYYYRSGEYLQSLSAPFNLLNWTAGCNCVYHKTIIDYYYDDIVNILNRTASECVPRIPIRSLKPYWNQELNKLKEYSIDMHKLWKQCGCPRGGIINSARLKAKLDYKTAIKQAQLEPERSNSDELYNRPVMSGS